MPPTASPSSTGPRGPAAGPGEPPAPPDPRRWKALAVTLLAGFVVLLDVTIVAVALPSLQTDLDAGPSQVQWVVSGYTLTSALMLVTGGRLGDAWGRKRMFVVSLAAFIACSALAGLAPSIGWLVVARLLQGVAGGALTPQSSGLIQQLFSRGERGRAFGLFGATVGLATALGPVIGGGILAVAPGEDGWRWIFYVNVPVGLVALALAARLLPRDSRGGPLQLDVVGTLLLGAATFAALLPLVTAEDGGLLRLWWLFGAAALLGVAFVRWEHRVVARGGAPLLDPRLVTRTPGYAAGVALISVYFVGFSGVFLVLALFFQSGLGYTPLQSGLAVTPFSIAAAVSAVVAGRLVARAGRLLTVLGLVGVATGFGAAALLLLAAPAAQAGWWIAPALVVAGLGGGFVISPNTTMTLSRVPVEDGGVAGGTLQTGQRVGGAIGTALLPGLFYLVLAEDNATHAVAVALGGATAVVVLALVVAVLDRRAGLRRDRGRRGRGRREPSGPRRRARRGDGRRGTVALTRDRTPASDRLRRTGRVGPAFVRPASSDRRRGDAEQVRPQQRRVDAEPVRGHVREQPPPRLRPVRLGEQQGGGDQRPQVRDRHAVPGPGAEVALDDADDQRVVGRRAPRPGARGHGQRDLQHRERVRPERVAHVEPHRPRRSRGHVPRVEVVVLERRPDRPVLQPRAPVADPWQAGEDAARVVAAEVLHVGRRQRGQAVDEPLRPARQRGRRQRRQPRRPQPVAVVRQALLDGGVRDEQVAQVLLRHLALVLAPAADGAGVGQQHPAPNGVERQRGGEPVGLQVRELPQQRPLEGLARVALLEPHRARAVVG